jgi:single-stranded-DNA-specific exonuclease
MPPIPRWKLPRSEAGAAETLARALDLRPPAARVLAHRGYVDPAAARRFLSPSLDDLHDPFLMAGMRPAVDRLASAVRRREPVLLCGDYDVDGTAAVVMLKTVIERAGGVASFHIPHRLREGYGLKEDTIEAAARGGVKLIVSADTGIRAHRALARAAALGVDVIVTDHHLPDSELPPAFAILNPKRPDCAYPERELCGAGVAFRLIEGLLNELGWAADRRRRMLASLLKLVAIATVADVVPLTGENRVLVRHGLEGLGDVRNPGLRALLEVAGFTPGQAPSAHQVAFRIAPRLNAAGRMADARDVIELLLTGDTDRARELASKLHSLNQDRQQTESEIVRRILEQCEREPVGPQDKALVFAGEGWHRGVLGIVASRIVERFYRPAFVLGVDQESGLAQGSGRSIPPFHLLEALETMPELFHNFGGHRQAAGVTLAADRVEEFRERLNRHAGAVLSAEDLTPELSIDAVVSLRELDAAAVDELWALGPFGFGNPAPVFAVFGAELASEPIVMKEKHLRFMLRQGPASLTVKAWNFAGRVSGLFSGARVDVAFALERDDYALRRGMDGWSAVARDVRIARGA